MPHPCRFLRERRSVRCTSSRNRYRRRGSRRDEGVGVPKDELVAPDRPQVNATLATRANITTRPTVFTYRLFTPITSSLRHRAFRAQLITSTAECCRPCRLRHSRLQAGSSH